MSCRRVLSVPRAHPASMDMLQTVMRSSIESDSDALSRVLDDVTEPSVDADLHG